jgi:hypothetical protein
LIIQGPEPSRLDPSLPDGGIPPVVGVQSCCVFRASKDVPDLADQYGWTYHHHVDMACWKGRLYVGWNSCERDEDVWPSRELYSTSFDSVTWTDPQEMFPQGVSTCLRMYFYLASNGRMLMIAGKRSGTNETSEESKGGLVVREIRIDHTLGPVYTLQNLAGPAPSPPTPGEGRGEGPAPMFDQSTDSEFIRACRQLLTDTVFLEQQDLGRLLGAQRMKWHDPAAWPDRKIPGDSDKWRCGKAFSFFRRPDNTLVGVCKMGFVTTSTDEGKTWTQPIVPPSLVTGKAKVWAQGTTDGRYAMVYNPSRGARYPLIAVTSDDGVHFRDMRIIQGELPIQRYAGMHRSIGPQYTRGISSWADDHSRDDKAMWLVYSMSKEDIWVSRVPMPIKPDATSDHEPWNTYCPKWASIRTFEDRVELENRDPYDYARAVRMLPPQQRVKVSVEVTAHQSDRGTLQIELMGGFGSARPVRICLTPAGRILVSDSMDLGSYATNQALQIQIVADTAKRLFSVVIDGRTAANDLAFGEPCESIHRLSLRTGNYRGIGGARPVAPGTDRPTEPVRYDVRLLNLLQS